MLAVTRDEVSSSRFSRVTANGSLLWRTDFIGPPPSRRTEQLVDAEPPEYIEPKPYEIREPQAFLVEQEAGAQVAPHFHYVDQFQVIVAGDGILGRHPVAPFTVHFAGAHTGYGPIIPGSNGLMYFTFRASADSTGAQYLPGASRRMRKGQRRNLVAEDLPVSSSASLASRQQNQIDIGLEAEDGLSVQLLRIAPKKSLRLPDFSLGAGVSMVVVAGAVVFDGKHYGLLSCLYGRQDEASPELVAGAGGAEVLFLRYPRRALTS
jgi:hypothetical protein